MIWKLGYLPEAIKDISDLEGSKKQLVQKAIKKVLQNPLPQSEGGYGKPLGNQDGNNLTGLLKIKIKDIGIRIVYKLEKQEEQMIVVVIGAREDKKVYSEAYIRRIHNDI